jgi:hypothetical protein
MNDLCKCGGQLVAERERKYGLCVSCQAKLVAETAPRGYPVADCEVPAGPAAVTFDKVYCACGRELITPIQILTRRCECCAAGVTV